MQLLTLETIDHMQAHALTPHMENALARWDTKATWDVTRIPESEFPFLSLLASGGHTLLLLSEGLCSHKILATVTSFAIGDCIDKCARIILPPEAMPTGDTRVVYGKLLEDFAFGPPGLTPESDYFQQYEAPPDRAGEITVYESPFGWRLTPPLANTRAMDYNFSGIFSQVQALMQQRPEMDIEERRHLAKHTMRLAFEHLASRLLIALKDDPKLESITSTLVLAGGVASNKYLRHILRTMLEVRGHKLSLTCPSTKYCTDNAAMIAWAGVEMYYKARLITDLGALALPKWSLESIIEGTDSWMQQGPKEPNMPKSILTAERFNSVYFLGDLLGDHH